MAVIERPPGKRSKYNLSKARELDKIREAEKKDLKKGRLTRAILRMANFSAGFTQKKPNLRRNHPR